MPAVRRPIGRAVRAAERRIAPLRRLTATLARRVQALVDRLVMCFLAVRHRPARPEDLIARIGSLPTVPTRGRDITVIVVGSGGGLTPDVAEVAPVPASEVVRVDPATDQVAAVSRAVAATTSELVVVALATTEPVDRSWLPRLAAAVTDGVVAATPVLIHPVRAGLHATPHDGQMRVAGLGFELTPDGAPAVVALRPGAAVDPGAPVADVDAASGACVLFDRVAFEAAGGFPPADDLDIAVAELSAHLQAAGGRIVVVPGAVLVDHRPVRTRRDLLGPIDPNGRGWRDAIDRAGPVLMRAARPPAPGARRFAITVAAPSSKVARRWGDWHLAEGLAAGLRRLGQEVRLQTADQSDDPVGRSCDVHLVLRGLQPVRRSAGQRHVLWIISHPEEVRDEELEAADLVLVASPRFAEHLRGRTATTVEVLLQATDQHRFFPRPVDGRFEHPVTVVAKTRGQLRPIVADAVSVGLRPAIYGGGWRDLVDPTLVVTDHLDNEALPVVYSSAGVVLNDHWASMRTWGFISNRLYDVLACGTPVISDPVPGIAEQFGGAVLEYHSPAELRTLVDGVLGDPTAARSRADAGRTLVRAGHTFDHRAGELLAALARYEKKI